MGTCIESAVVLALGREMWSTFQRWMLGETGQPKNRPSVERDTVWGAYLTEGLRPSADLGELHWPQAGQRRPKTKHGKPSGRKDLHLPLARGKDEERVLKNMSKRLNGGRVVAAGITREWVGSSWSYFALLRVQGVPYRSPEYLQSLAPEGSVVGLDPGPSLLACVGEHESKVIDLAGADERDGRSQTAAHPDAVRRPPEQWQKSQRLD